MTDAHQSSGGPAVIGWPCGGSRGRPRPSGQCPPLPRRARYACRPPWPPPRCARRDPRCDLRLGPRGTPQSFPQILPETAVGTAHLGRLVLPEILVVQPLQEVRLCVLGRYEVGAVLGRERVGRRGGQTGVLDERIQPPCRRPAGVLPWGWVGFDARVGSGCRTLPSLPPGRNGHRARPRAAAVLPTRLRWGARPSKNLPNTEPL